MPGHTSKSEQLLKDPAYLAVMDQIDAICLPKVHISFNTWHGISHALGVMRHAENILTQLHADAHTIELGKIAALLHDISLKSGDKKNHAELSSEQAQYFLDILSIPSTDQKTIKTAISRHSKGGDNMSHIDLAIVLADKLDIAKDRLRPDANMHMIQKEMAKIDKIEYTITEQSATLQYWVDADLDLENFLEWPKSLTVPRNAATQLKKKFIFRINDKAINKIPV